MNPMKASYKIESNLTVLGKRLLIFYTVIYILELVCEYWLNIPVVEKLMLHPLASGYFHVYQVITHPFIHDPRAPFSFLINCILFYFFANSVETRFGQKRFISLFLFSALGSALLGLAFSTVKGFNVPFMGMLPSLLSIIIIYGFSNPEADVLLMFVFPVKAKYLSYGTVLVTFLTFLAKVNPHGAYHLGGMLFGYIYSRGIKNLMNFEPIYLRFLQWRLKRKKSEFRVIDGGNQKNDDKPTYH